MPPALPAARRGCIPARRRVVRRRQPAVGRSRVRGRDPMGGRDRAARDGGRRHPHRRGRGHGRTRRPAGPDEGRSAARRARVLRGVGPRVVGTAVPEPTGLPAQRPRRRARQAERVRRSGGARVDGAGVPRRLGSDPVGSVPEHDPHRAQQVEGGEEVRRDRDRAVLGGRHRRDRRRVRSARRRAAPSHAGGRTSPRATRSRPW